MASTEKVTIERIDHGVVPSNDLGRAHRFWGSFMGGEIDHLTNLNLRGLNREVPQIIFYTLANHRGWGIALQDFAKLGQCFAAERSPRRTPTTRKRSLS